MNSAILEKEINTYFDYNATTPMSETVKLAIIDSLSLFANPSSQYQKSLPVRNLLVSARQAMASLLNCDEAELVFTSGGSEANNLAIKGVLGNIPPGTGHVVISSIEHPSVLEVIRYFESEKGLAISWIKPDSSGAISASDVQQSLRADTKMVILMAVNNETGTIQPFYEVAELAQQHNIHCHIDGVQAVGKLQLNCHELQAHSLSFASHKFYGPKGIGGLYIRKGCSFSPLIHGGGQESGWRAGTENTLGLAGLAAAAREAKEKFLQWQQQLLYLRGQLIAGLQREIPGILINGTQKSDQVVANTINVSLPGIRAEALAALLDVHHQIAVSIGSACSNNKASRRSHVLQAMGLNNERIDSAVRISIGQFTNEHAINHLIKAISTEYQALLALSMDMEVTV
ncbi:cysteine desulfurase [Zooshikella marina]|uniref:cysteine desulfurase family protein n=1 Tax=Zooshikella ganghwensis TaxID=202772 RepID=UPI001BB02BB4|nr:cysteine desulfurase family protein [Zooshikella ganghwensis]MBU2705969.1 cysteine desulfurase [Zooshikella ganghwensis]